MNTGLSIGELAHQVAACYLAAHGQTFTYEGVVMELDVSSLSNTITNGARETFMEDANDTNGEQEAIHMLLMVLNGQRNGLSSFGRSFVTDVLQYMVEDVIDLLYEAASGNVEALAFVRKAGEFR